MLEKQLGGADSKINAKCRVQYLNQGLKSNLVIHETYLQVQGLLDKRMLKIINNVDSAFKTVN